MAKAKRASNNDWPSIIRTMLRDEGLTFREASARTGRSESYIGGVVQNAERGSDPNVWTVAAIAEACGYQLRLTGHGKSFRIRP